MIAWISSDCLAEFLSICKLAADLCDNDMCTHAAPSKSFAANSLLPSAFKASAMIQDSPSVRLLLGTVQMFEQVQKQGLY